MININNKEELYEYLEIFNELSFPEDKDPYWFAKFCSILKKQDLIQLKHNNIEIRKSSIHGFGVFATKDIPKDKIITFYPGDSFYYPINGKHNILLLPDSDNNEFKDNILSYKESYGFFTNCSKFGEYGIIGNPKSISSKNFLGHMINDGIGNVFKDIMYNDLVKDISLFKGLFKKYVSSISKCCNCVILSHSDFPIVYIKSTKDIPKDTELTIDYNLPYWFCLTYNKIDSDFNELMDQILDSNLKNFIYENIKHNYDI